MLLGVTAHQFFVTGLISVVFILLFKWLAGRSGIAGLQHAAGAV